MTFTIEKDTQLNINQDPYFWTVECKRISYRFKQAEMIVYLYDSESDFNDRNKEAIESYTFIYSNNDNANFSFDDNLSKEILMQKDNYLTKHLEDYIRANTDTIFLRLQSDNRIL